MPQPSRTLQLNLLVLLLATTTVLGRLISLPATAMVAWRTLLAMLGMGLWLMIGKKAPVRIPPALACKFLGVGGVIGLHWLLLFASVQVSNISIGLTGMASISLSQAKSVNTPSGVSTFEPFTGSMRRTSPSMPRR